MSTFILKLPDEKLQSKLMGVLSVEPAQKRQLEHIATLTNETGNVLKACAAANVARWILRNGGKP